MSELKRHHINEVMDMHALTRGELCYSQVYYADDVDQVIAKLNARIHELENMPHTDNSAVIENLINKNESLKNELTELRKENELLKNRVATLDADIALDSLPLQKATEAAK